MIELALKVGADIIVGNAYKLSEKGVLLKDSKKRDKIPVNSYHSLEFLKILLENNVFLSPVWLNLYKRELLVSNNFYFKYGIL
ncbi:MAG: hypothetical protein ABDH59_03890, partial [Fervidobacterium sp.]